jgi:transcriptional regulator with XRE-family HTH domain
MAEALRERDMGAVIRIFRKWTGASQTDVSVLTGMPQPHVSELERGLRKVTALELFERIAEGLDIPRCRIGLAESDDRARRPGDGTANYRESEADEQVKASHEQWLGERARLGRYRPQITRLVTNLYPDSDRIGETGILIPPRWRLAEPVDLGAVGLRWQGDAPQPKITGQHAETRELRPLARRGERYTRYHRAVRDLSRPRLFENRFCYRLLDVAPSEAKGQQRLSLSIGGMCYFDMIDASEPLAHEAARVSVDGSGRLHEGCVNWDRLPYRRLVRDPFQLATYPMMLSISTLTMRRSESGVTFLLLRRDRAKVAIAGGMLSVLPTGVFQPASVLPAPESPDFDLWRNIMREYSEEFLGNPEHDGDGPLIDYENTEPFRTLENARRAGRLRVWCLGVGVDALNYVSDVLTVTVFDADLFDSIFERLVDENDEGDIVSVGDDSRELRFEASTVARLLAEGKMAPSGAACLDLAWRHRATILG